MQEYQYYSKKLGKIFDTVEALKAAEKAFDEAEQKKIAAAKEAEAKLKEMKAQREMRAKEIEEAIKELNNQQQKVAELKRKFIEDYGSWHYTYKLTDANGILDSIFKIW